MLDFLFLRLEGAQTYPARPPASINEKIPLTARVKRQANSCSLFLKPKIFFSAVDYISAGGIQPHKYRSQALARYAALCMLTHLRALSNEKQTWFSGVFNPWLTVYC